MQNNTPTSPNFDGSSFSKYFSYCTFIVFVLSISNNLVAQNTISSNFPSTQIGNIEWMTENLNIPSPQSCCYNDSLENCEKYGRLYYYEEAVNICPEGWRLPTVNDFDSLEAYFYQKDYNHQDLMAPNAWIRYPDASNRSQLSFLPAGMKHKKSYRSLGKSTSFWLHNPDYPTKLAHIHVLDFKEKKKTTNGKTNKEYVLYAYDHEHEKKMPIGKKRLFSVRCVRSVAK